MNTEDFGDRIIGADKDLKHLRGSHRLTVHVWVFAIGFFIISACALIVTIFGLISTFLQIHISSLVPVALPIASYAIGRFAIALVKK